jgi:hypothetical protein
MPKHILDSYQLAEISSMLKSLVATIYDIGLLHLPCHLFDPNSDYQIGDLHKDVTELIDRINTSNILP